MKTTSLFALAATAGLTLGMAQASAADLGGNCCADLEERIAELEATTARKGNRKVSLVVSGQVNRIITNISDGSIRKTYIGLDSTNSSSRFAFTGMAKISPSWSAGFDITIEIEAGGTSSKISQLDEDGKVGTQIDACFGEATGATDYLCHYGILSQIQLPASAQSRVGVFAGGEMRFASRSKSLSKLRSCSTRNVS